MKIVLMRADERLVHGRIINEWCKHIRPTYLLIADNKLAEDAFMANMYKALVPLWLDTVICTIKDAARFIREKDTEDGKIFVLCRTPVEFKELYEEGIWHEQIVLADKRYFPNKIEISQDCKEAINWLLEKGVSVMAQDSMEEEMVEIKTYK